MLPLINSFQLNKKAKCKYNQASHSLLAQYSHMQLDHRWLTVEKTIANENENRKKV